MGRQNSFDIILADLCMPGMSGEDVLLQIQGERPYLPVILVTGKGDIQSAVRSIRAGACDYITKPVNEDELRWPLSATSSWRNLALVSGQAAAGASGERSGTGGAGYSHGRQDHRLHQSGF